MESDPNPKPNVNHIGGIPIEFPYPPYGSQLAYMSRVIATLDRAQRDGHFHALLESPTGTGKSLSLLCSVLAWQKNHRSKSLYGNIDPLGGQDGGFVPDMEQPSANPTPDLYEKNNVMQKVVIYYASRTHLQISQVIREFRKTSYHVPMAVLGSRKRYCINAKVRGQDNIDEKCKILLKQIKRKKVGCREYVNTTMVRAHPSLRKGGCYEVHDIEDLVKVGEMVQGCPYFAAQAMAEVADIVFCPYSYIINPQIRQAMEINLKGNIIILDEAHNIEDVAREAGSIDVEECALIRNWGADKAVKELQEANISMQCFPSLQDCATMVILLSHTLYLPFLHLQKIYLDILLYKSNVKIKFNVLQHCSKVQESNQFEAEIASHLFSSLTCFFSKDGKHICDYQLVLQCHNINGDAGLDADDWPCTFSLWCLNPALVFKNMSDGALSVILTSGTLSPMSSFQSELGIQFGTSLVAPHVINVDSQLWAGVIHQGPNNYPLNASYKTSEAHAFQDALGTSLEEICKVVPGGCLVFFPSYKLIDKLLSRWSHTGQWSHLNAQKPVFVEPRGGKDEFENVLKGYFDTIRQGNKPMTGRRRGCCNAIKSEGNSNGATLLAVCRGKVSEGIDFSDDYARTVFFIRFDIQVAEKKKYNDTFKSSKGLLSGNEWYCQQAFRALNQAAGRCIRHRFDYGAIIFLDERFRQEKNLTYISKWIRSSIRQHDSFEQSLEGLKSFFRDVKVENNGSSKKPINVTPIDVEEPRNWFKDMKNGNLTTPNVKRERSASEGVTAPETMGQAENSGSSMKPINVEPIKVEEPINWFTDMKNRKLTKPNLKGQTMSDNKTGIAYVDLEDDLETQDRCSSPTPIILSPDDFKEPPRDNDHEPLIKKETLRDNADEPIILSPDETPRDNDHELLIKKETPIKENYPITLESDSEHEQSNSTIFQTKFPDQKLPHSFSSPCSTSASGIMHAFVTPKKQQISQNRSPLLDMSVNSRFHKRRKPSVVKMEPLDPQSCILEVPDTSSTDAMKKDVKISCSICRHPLGLEDNNYIVPCSIMSLSMVHLASVWKGELEKGPTRSVPVMVSDITSVDSRISCEEEEEIWSKEDGCVYNKILCTFCSNCLGLRVVAITNSSNVQLLNKVLLFFF
uniref:Regulator of telomere elongation helicase 1 homolog n=3 Tax=Helianthus annuus TaxID=4232 RepID=A0A251UK31_HELAN